MQVCWTAYGGAGNSSEHPSVTCSHFQRDLAVLTALLSNWTKIKGALSGWRTMMIHSIGMYRQWNCFVCGIASSFGSSVCGDMWSKVQLVISMYSSLPVILTITCRNSRFTTLTVLKLTQLSCVTAAGIYNMKPWWTRSLPDNMFACNLEFTVSKC